MESQEPYRYAVQAPELLPVPLSHKAKHDRPAGSLGAIARVVYLECFHTY